MSEIDPLVNCSGTLIVITLDGGAQFKSLKKNTSAVTRTILIDPLANSAEFDLQDEIISSIVSDPEIDLNVVHFSLPGLKGIGDPSEALLNIYPNLEVVKRTETSRVSAREISALFTCTNNKPIQVYLHVPGAEFLILKHLEHEGVLENIDLLHVVCSIEPMFSRSTTKGTLVNWLNERGLTALIVSEKDLDWHDILFSKDNSKNLIIENQKSKNDLMEAREFSKILMEKCARLEEQIARNAFNAEIAIDNQNMVLNEQDFLRREHDTLLKKYANLFEEKKELEELIAELLPKLQEASEHLKDLAISQSAND